MLKLLEALYEGGKNDLVGCNPQDFIAKQAKVKTYLDLIQKLKFADNIPQE